MIRSKSQDVSSTVNFLANQVSHLTEMMTRLAKFTSTSKQAWVKKSDMEGREFDHAFKGKSIHGSS
jgi:hypothetical protein